MNIAEANVARLISGFSGFLTFNARLRFTQLHENVTSHNQICSVTSHNQLCSELLLRQSKFHLTFSSCSHGHIKTLYIVI